MNIVKHIPNTITSMNLLSGVIGVVFTLKGNIELAFPLMIAAACFDFLDGFTARLLGAYSDIGKELDSLADLISFGLLPSVMLYQTMVFCNASRVVSCIPLILVVFSALRLAKFNVDDRQHGSFLGLPTPASAMICGSFAYCMSHTSYTWIANACATWYFIPLMAVVLSALLVSEISMFAMKFGKDIEVDYKTKIQRIAFIAGIVCIAVAVAVLQVNWSLIVLLTFVYYILLNLALLFARK